MVIFVKFHGPVCKIPRLTAAKLSKFRGIPFVRKISFILFKKLQFLDVGMALSNASNLQRKLSIFFFSKVQFVN